MDPDYILHTANYTHTPHIALAHCMRYATLVPVFLSVGCSFFCFKQIRIEAKIFFLSPGWNWTRFSTSPARRRTLDPVSC